jgi:urease alpha subunit
MPKGVITEEQKAKRLAGLKDHHAKGKTGEANTSANTVRPRKNKALVAMYERISSMVPKALNVLEDSLDGKDVDKQQYDTAKFIVNTERAVNKDKIEHEAALLRYKVDMEKAKTLGAIPKEDPQQVARDAAAKGQHLTLFTLELPEDYEEEEIED